MTTTTASMLSLVVAAITGANTAAGSNVYSPLDWATTDIQYPAITVRPTAEDKQSLLRGPPSFLVTLTLLLVGKVEAGAQANDAGAAAAEVACMKLARQVEVAVINQYAVTLPLQQFPFVRTQYRVNAEGENHYAEFAMELGLEFIQTEDDFAPVVGQSIDQVAVYGDLQNVYDPNGTYPNPPYPAEVVAAPRTSGPDGRSEIAALIPVTE
jgi:hypothetical protein